MTTLPQYIERIGDHAAAQLFGISVRTAAAYRRQERTPRPEKAKQMVAVSKGELSMDAIYSVAESEFSQRLDD